MNKKIFTLLASSLMLLLAVFSTNAQRSWVGDTVRYLPNGTGKGAYHLVVTSIGNRSVADTLITLNDYGYLGFADSTYIHTDYPKLREAMWCINVAQENYGQVPAYTFTNKEYGTDLAVSNTAWIQTGISSNSPSVGFPNILRQRIIYPSATAVPSDSARVYASGEYTQWAFSRTYNTSQLQTDQPLRLEIDGEPDYYLTFAVDDNDALFLAKVHYDDLYDTTSDFYQNNLVRFSIVNASARVLTAEDFNTTLYERASGYTTLLFNPDVTTNQYNPFAQELTATDVAGTNGDGRYLYLQKRGGNYLYVDDTYHNAYGTMYPVIKDDATARNTTNNTDQFRLVYYPSEDSLVINVREVINPDIPTGSAFDNLPYNLGQDGLYNWAIWSWLVIGLQDLDNVQTDRIITAHAIPADTRIYFDIAGCETVDPNRTTVEPDLYTIRDTQGRYLVVPMVAGDFTPQWNRLVVDNLDNNDTLEVALKTPSYQWFVTKVNNDSETSRIFLTNREFNWIRLEYVQIYKNAQPFDATWSFLTDSLNPGATYVIRDKANVSVDGFTVVKDDAVAAAKKEELIKRYTRTSVGQANHQVEAWMQHMPQDLMEKLYRTSPFLGYKAILPDTMNYYGYSFQYLNKLNSDWYMGVTEERNANGDTLIYVEEERTFFELNLPDTLRAYGREKYGLGHGTNSIYMQYPNTQDIAPLERYYYHFKINDYFKYDWNDNYLVLNDAARYVYTDEATANSRELNKAKFYMRFTFEKNDREYYALIDRIDKSNFEYLTNTVGLNITDTLKVADASHGAINNNGFGVIVANVTGLNGYVGATPKTLGTETVSTFALGQMQDELYRRFNTELEECGRGEEGDEPRTLKFYRYEQPLWFVYEDNQSQYAIPGSGIHFMGVENETQCTTDKGHWHADHNYAIYVDTAYVNRGTGHIKPQYMLVVDPKIQQGGTGCNSCGDSIDFRPYVYGRYLRNMTDHARVNGTPNGAFLDRNYIWDGTWERLAFVDAIHAGDSLYILNGTPIESLYSDDADGQQYLNFARIALYPNIEVVDLGNNLHKDEVFSMRFVERQRDKVGNPIEGAGKQFFIESETTNRDWTQGRMIAPMHGGWIKWENEVPVLSRGSYRDAIGQAEKWDVSCAGVDELPTNNDDILTTKVAVVAGNGNVTILNAAGKQVVISNVLGQTIANQVLTSDNATIQVPKGIVVVAVEGEDAVKTVVK